MKFPALNQLQIKKKKIVMPFESRGCFAFIKKCAEEKWCLHRHVSLIVLSWAQRPTTAHLSGATITQPHTKETIQCHIVQEKQIIVNTLWTAWISSQFIIHWISSSAGDKKFPSQTIKTVETKIKLLKWGNVTLRSVHSRPSGNVSSVSFLIVLGTLVCSKRSQSCLYFSRVTSLVIRSTWEKC